MVAREGYLVIRRRRPSEIGFGVRLASPASVPSQVVYQRYRGFEGDPWPVDDEQQSLSDRDIGEYSFDEARDFLVDAEARHPDDRFELTYVRIGVTGDAPTSRHPHFEFVGYDYGTYISKWNTYSVLFNEVLFGRHEELQIFARLLNENLLFDSLADLHQLDDVRSRLYLAGADLETASGAEEVLCAVAVFCFNRSTGSR